MELDEIAALVAAGDDVAAFARLRRAYGWPRGKDGADLVAWVRVLGVDDAVSAPAHNPGEPPRSPTVRTHRPAGDHGVSSTRRLETL